MRLAPNLAKHTWVGVAPSPAAVRRKPNQQPPGLRQRHLVLQGCFWIRYVFENVAAVDHIEESAELVAIGGDVETKLPAEHRPRSGYFVALGKEPGLTK